MHQAVLSLLVSILVAGGSPIARAEPVSQPESAAASPAPEQFEQVTWVEVRRGWSEYEYEGLVGAYRRHNQIAGDAPLDPTIDEFLRVCADGFAGDRSVWPRARELITEEALVTSSDPFVQGIVDSLAGTAPTDPDESQAHSQRLIKRLRDAGYPPVRIGGVILTAMDRADRVGNTQHWVDMAPMAFREGVRAAQAPDLTSSARRHIYAKFFEPAMEWPIGWYQFMKDEITEAEDLDPWIRSQVLGAIERKRAWHERTEARRADLTAQQRLLFEEYMLLAGGHYVRAWEIDPSCPEPASGMIDVAMTMDLQNPGFFAWFMRALEAQVDYEFAYERLRNALRPHWRGSPEILARTVIDFNRPELYATAAVWEAKDFFVTAEGAWASRGMGGRAYEDPELVNAMIELMTSFIDAEPETSRADHARSWIAYIKHRTGDHAGAVATALDVRGEHSSAIQRAVDRVGTRLSAQILVHGVDAPDEIERATELESSGAWRRAADAWKEVQSFIEPEADPRVALAVAHRRRVAEWNDQFAGGDWVDIRFDEGLPGLAPLLGKWIPQGDSVRLSGYNDETILFIPIRTNNRHVFEATLTIPERWVEHTRMGLIYGAGTRQTDRFDMHRNMTIWPHASQAVTAWYWSRKDHAMDIDPDQRTFRLRLIQDGIRVRVSFDGRVLHDGEMTNVNPRSEPKTHSIGLGGWQMLFGGGTNDAIFTDVRVRALRDDDFEVPETIGF